MDYNEQFNALHLSKQIYSIRHMNTIVNKSFNNKKVNYIIVKDDPWFRGKDIATILEYADTKQAIRVNVDTEDKQKLEKLRGVLNTPWTIMN